LLNSQVSVGTITYLPSPANLTMKFSDLNRKILLSDKKIGQFGISKCGGLFCFENQQLTLITRNFRDILQNPTLYKDLLLTASRRTVNYNMYVFGKNIILIIDIFYIQIKSLKDMSQKILKFHSVFAPIYHVDSNIEINYNIIEFYDKKINLKESIRFLYTLSEINHLFIFNKIISKLEELKIQEPSELILKSIGIFILFFQIFFYINIRLKNTRVTQEIKFKKGIAYTHGLFNKRRVKIKTFTKPDYRYDNETKILSILDSPCFLKYMFIEETSKTIQFVTEICGEDLLFLLKTKSDLFERTSRKKYEVLDKMSGKISDRSLGETLSSRSLGETLSSRSLGEIKTNHNLTENTENHNLFTENTENHNLFTKNTENHNLTENTENHNSFTENSFFDEFFDKQTQFEMDTWNISGMHNILLEDDIFNHQKEILKKLQFCLQITQIFVKLHKSGIAYCNVCPENLFFKNNIFFLANFEESYHILYSNNEFINFLSNGNQKYKLGTENYRSPEIIEHNLFKKSLSVEDCQKSDIFSLAIIFHQILTGKHPFEKNSINIEDNILHHNYTLDFFLSGPIIDLFHHMLKKNLKIRPNIFTIEKHPVFWNNEKIYNFFATLSDLLEFHGETSLKIYTRLERNKSRVFNNKWINKIDDILVEDLRNYRIYNFNNVKGLLRVIRNKGRHYKETQPQIRNLFGSFPDGFIDYFTKRFPNLLMVCFYSSKAAANDELLSIFF
ncbi:Serine/threonine protein kinase and endoribonuclease ERN1/IRE1, partial [Pseudoloma neurophilia]